MAGNGSKGASYNYYFSNIIIIIIIMSMKSFREKSLAEFRGSGLLMLNFLQFFATNTHCALVVALSEKKQVAFGISIGNEELKHECFPKHSHMGTARMK